MARRWPVIASARSAEANPGAVGYPNEKELTELDWTEIGKTAAPALVGAGSAILSALLPNIYAERRHHREMTSKERELNRRTLETLAPHRLTAYQAVFVLLQSVKSGARLTTDMLV